MSKAAVSWTGGKDSSLAFYEAKILGYEICSLVTFDWSQELFLTHPLGLINLQAQALGCPHYRIKVNEPFDQSYESAISSLKKQHGIDTLVTGDIGEVAGHDPNWLVDRAAHSKVNVVRPLWHNDKIELLNKLLNLKFRVVFSCVKRPWFTEDWLGLELSQALVGRLREVRERTGLDMCGEQGEYHTLVVDAPRFRKRIQIESYSKRVEGSVMYLVLEKLKLSDKA